MTNETLMAPALTDESMESKLIALAMEQAAAEMEAGTASSQIVTHFLRLGSRRAEVELAKLTLESELIQERIKSERKGQEMAEQLTLVIQAMETYSAPAPELPR